MTKPQIIIIAIFLLVFAIMSPKLPDISKVEKVYFIEN